MSRSAVTTHVLDAARGRPASGLDVVLSRVDGDVVAAGCTDDDGRVSELGPESLPPGTYRLAFGVGRWFAAQGVEAFYPEVVVAFEIRDMEQHHHVPLLLSPFAYSTYRGT